MLILIPLKEVGLNMDSTRKIRLKRKNDLKQKVWNYMRRNKRFRVGDIMMILEVRDGTIRPIMWALESAKYIRIENEAQEYKDRIYTFVKDTGIKSPSIINGDIYDHNTKEEFKLQKQPTSYRMRLKLLKAMSLPLMTKDEIAKSAEVSITGGWAKQEFLYLNIKGAIARTNPIQRREKEILFTVNKEKRDELIRDIEESLRPVRTA